MLRRSRPSQEQLIKSKFSHTRMTCLPWCLHSKYISDVMTSPMTHIVEATSQQDHGCLRGREAKKNSNSSMHRGTHGVMVLNTTTNKNISDDACNTEVYKLLMQCNIHVLILIYCFHYHLLFNCWFTLNERGHCFIVQNFNCVQIVISHTFYLDRVTTLKCSKWRIPSVITKRIERNI